MSSKQALRAAVRQQKSAMTSADIAVRSEALCRMVLQTRQYQQASTLYGYLPFNQEVDLMTLLRQAMVDGKQVALPKCYGKEMRFILMSDLTRVRPGAIGAPEPAEDSPVAADPSALVIVPGLVFDRNGFRIGYGGGYYDRFLSAEPHHPTIGLCYSFQLTDRLEPDPHDIPVDLVFSL